MSKKRQDRLDQVDAEHIRMMLGSPGWQLVKRGIEAMMQQKVRDLVRPHTEAETATLRGEIAAIETVLALPESLVQKAKQGAPDED
jgi:hypothetical protein